MRPVRRKLEEALSQQTQMIEGDLRECMGCVGGGCVLGWLTVLRAARRFLRYLERHPGLVGPQTIDIDALRQVLLTGERERWQQVRQQVVRSGARRARQRRRDRATAR